MITAKRTPADKGTLEARAEALTARRQSLEHEIRAEQSRPLPDTSRLRFLKRARLRAKDELVSIRGLLRTLGRRAMRPGRAAA